MEGRPLADVQRAAGQPSGLYALLGVRTDASGSEVDAAYERVKRIAHPDLVPGKDPAVFHLLTHAYHVLGDDNLRRMYDARGGISGCASRCRAADGEDICSPRAEAFAAVNLATGHPETVDVYDPAQLRRAATFAVGDCSRAARKTRRILLVWHVATLVLLIFLAVQSVERTSQDRDRSTLADVTGDDGSVVLGSFPRGLDTSRLLPLLGLVVVCVWGVLCVTRTRRMGIIVTAAYQIALVPLVGIFAVVDAGLLLANLDACEPFPAGTCSLRNVITVVAGEWLLILVLLTAVAIGRRLVVQLGRPRGLPSTTAHFRAQVVAFHRNLVRPSSNPSCAFCAERVAEELIDWHEEHCPGNVDTCQDCFEAFQHAAMRAHREGCLSQSIPCLRCRDFVTLAMHDSHVYYRCSLRTEFCPFCRQPFIVGSALESHKDRCSSRPSRCLHCNASVPRCNLEKHVRVCATVGIHEHLACPSCGERIRKDALASHVGGTCAKRPASCPLCTCFFPSDIVNQHIVDCATAELRDRGGTATLGIRVAFDDGYLRIASVEPVSPAARAGLAVGDTLRSVDGRRTESFLDYARALWAAGIAAQVQVTGFRTNGSESASLLAVSLLVASDTIPLDRLSLLADGKHGALEAIPVPAGFFDADPQ